MGTNTSIYGEQSSWISMGGDHENLDNSYFFANFGSGSSYDVSTLKAAVDNGKFALDTPIDKSISWCGLGVESAFSNIETYNNKVWEDENDSFRMMNKDLRYITNFGLFGKPDKWTLASPTVSSWYYSDATAQDYASRARWAPEAGDGDTSTKSNFNLGLMPITQLPMRNCVAVPVIECCTAVDVSPSNDGRTRVYGWEYFNSNSEINYTNHPYITAIGMQLWGWPSDDFSGRRTNRISNNLHIAVLDETNACKDQPFDVEQPTRKQGTTYQYYGMGRTYSTMQNRPSMGLTIMGLISTNNSTMILPHQDNYQRKSRGNMVIPHPEGKLGYVVNPSTATGVGDWVYYYVEYYDGLQEWIREQIACFGLFFTDDEQTAFSGELDDDNMFLGILEDGVGHGDYSHGEDNRKQPQWNWATTNQSPYDPSNPPDVKPPDADKRPIKPNTPGFTLAVGNGSVCYTMEQSDWRLLWNDIYGGATDWKSLIDGLALYGANPLNAILNYRWYPFTLGGSLQDYVRLGSTEIRPHQFTYIKDAKEAFTSASATFWWGRPKNFVNIRKSKARVWLPFYGYYELPMTQLVDRELQIQFQYNLPDDNGVWVIMFGSSIYDYVECQPYIEIPITGDNSLQIAAAKAQRNLSIAMTVGTAVAGIALGAAIAAPAIGAIGAAAVETASITGGSMIGAAAANIGPLAGEGLLAGLGTGLAGASGAAIGGGVKTANTVMNSALQIGNLSTNVPVHSTASDTTFLHLPFEPYVEVFTNKVIDGYNEDQYKLKVGISCDKWVGIDKMPANTLLKATGLADTSTGGMELDEINELNNIIQTGFYK